VAGPDGPFEARGAHESAAPRQVRFAIDVIVISRAGHCDAIEDNLPCV